MDERLTGILKGFSIRQPTPNELTLFIIIIISAVLLISGGIIYATIRRKRKNEAMDRAEFDMIAEKKKLDDEEKDLMQMLARFMQIPHPQQILLSRRIFDRCMERYIPRVRQENRERIKDILNSLRKKLGFEEVPLGKMLTSTRGIQPKQKVKLIFEREGGEALTFPSEVKSVDDFGIGLITPSFENGEVVRLNAGNELKVQFWRPNEAGYTFKTKVTKVIDGPFPKFIVPHCEKFDIVQQRDYVRVEIFKPVRFKLIPKDKGDPDLIARIIGDDNYPENNGRIINLSGDGALFNSPKNAGKDDMIFYRLELEDGSAKHPILSRVLGGSENKEGEGYALRTQFVDMPSRIRGEITKYLYRVQSASIKKEE